MGQGTLSREPRESQQSQGEAATDHMLRSMVQSAPVAIVVADQQGRIVLVNDKLAEMFGYATDLRSATQGRATYSMEFAKYHEAPANIAETIIKKAS